MHFKRKSEKGVLIVQAVVMIFIFAAVAGSLLSISTSGTRLEASRDLKFKSREIAEAALDLSLNALRQATDNFDNDGDGTVDEGKAEPDLFIPSVVAMLEGNLGRIGTVSWTTAMDSNGNGLPDFGETNVTPMPLSGGEVITYSIFSENDGLDNDNDGTTDEKDEAGSVSVIAQGRYGDYGTLIHYSGIFTDKWSPTSPPTWGADQAFAVGGDLLVTGDCTVSGSEGNVHSNGFLDLGGSSIISGDASASNGGNVDPANVTGTVDLWAPKIPIPDLTLNNLLGLREQAVKDGMDVYYLKSNGTIFKNGAEVSPGGTYHGWLLSPAGEWTLSGGQADLDGLFYTAADVKIESVQKPINMTLLSEGNISFNGNADFAPYYMDWFMVSLKDIVLAGTPSESGDVGAIFAREQIATEGNSYIRGAIVATDLDNASSWVEKNCIQGNFEVEYNGGLNVIFPVYNPDDFRYVFDPLFSGYEER